MITSKQRAVLRSLANRLEAAVQIGKNAVTPELTASLDEILEKRELVKLAVLNNCEGDVREMAAVLSERTHAEIVQIIGKKIVLFRQSKTKPVIEL